jgi:hypothetical protein
VAGRAAAPNAKGHARQGMAGVATEERAMSDCRTSRVKQVLSLEGRAAAARAIYEGGLPRIAPARHRAEQLEQQAKALKVTLTPAELSALRAARSGV